MSLISFAVNFKIRRNVPIPPCRNAGPSYPWPSMKVGDSFEFTHAKASSVHNAALAWCRHNKKKGWKWASRSNKDKSKKGGTIWRVA